MKQTQEQRVIYKLRRDGFITRNECLKVYIARLAARIEDLEKQGWQFKAERMKNGDFRYTLISEGEHWTEKNRRGLEWFAQLPLMNK